MESMAFPIPDDIGAEEVHVGSVPCLWMTPPEASASRGMLYLHGGGYVWGSPRTHGRLAAQAGEGLWRVSAGT